jgi:hypothetical protein
MQQTYPGPTTTQPAETRWPTWMAVAFALAWFAVLALAMYIGAIEPRQFLAWFIAFPMFALYPGVAAFAASRAKSPRLVIAVAALVPTAVLGWTLLSNAVTGSWPFVHDRRVMYFFVTLFAGLGLLYAIRMGTRVMRQGHVVTAYAVAGVVFITAMICSFYPAFVLTPWL